MDNNFNPRIKDISTIGKELRFQREYYCYKNNVSLPLKANSKKIDSMQTLQEVLYDFMQRNLGDNSELATSYDVLYAIENGKCKKKSEKYNANTYYLRMFFLFKLYNFLDSDTILELLESYNIQPNYTFSKEILSKIQQDNSVENLLRKGKMGKVIKINVKSKKIMLSKEQYINIFNCTKNELMEIENLEQESNHGKIIKVENKSEKQIKEYYGKVPLFLGYIWNNEQKELRNKMKKLSKIERYCLSLELGRDTLYIQNFIDDKLQNINIDTILKTLKYFNMQDYKIYDILLQVKSHLSKESMEFSYVEIV